METFVILRRSGVGRREGPRRRGRAVHGGHARDERPGQLAAQLRAGRTGRPSRHRLRSDASKYRATGRPGARWGRITARLRPHDLWLLPGAVVLADQVTKAVQPPGSFAVNTGGAAVIPGTIGDALWQSPTFGAVTDTVDAALLVIALLYSRQLPGRCRTGALIAIAGGLSNLADRLGATSLAHSALPRGSIDWIALWPGVKTNLADLGIAAGLLVAGSALLPLAVRAVRRAPATRPPPPRGRGDRCPDRGRRLVRHLAGQPAGNRRTPRTRPTANTTLHRRELGQHRRMDLPRLRSTPVARRRCSNRQSGQPSARTPIPIARGDVRSGPSTANRVRARSTRTGAVMASVPTSPAIMTTSTVRSPHRGDPDGLPASVSGDQAGRPNRAE